MNGQVQKHGYNSKVNVAFWENATFVFWLCQNSWFWVWKIFFSITIFKKNEFVSKVAPFILSLNHSKRAFVAFGFFLPQQKLLENAKFQLRKLLFDGVPIIGFEWNFVYRTKIKKIWRLPLQFWGRWWPQSPDNDLFTKGQFSPMLDVLGKLYP